MWIGDVQYQSVSEYADALIEACKGDAPIIVHAYQNDEDRRANTNALGGTVLFAPHSHSVVCDNISRLIQLVARED